MRPALVKAGKIPDPYYGYNNEQSLWVEEKEWWFIREFDLPSGLENKFINLIFEGIIYIGEVWLNGKQIGELEGMFNPRFFPINDVLRFNKKNILAVRLEAPPDARRRKKTNGLTFDMERDQLYSIAQCLFGWDWGPHAVPIGIWRPVWLQVTDAVQIKNPRISSTIKSNDLADLHISCCIMNISNLNQNITLLGTINGKNFKTKKTNLRYQLELKPQDKKTINFKVTIKNPQLWWPNEMGEQNLYLLDLKLILNEQVSDQFTTQFGIRELKIIENEKTDEFIKSMEKNTGSVYDLGRVVGAYPWTFQVNGKKLFAKGANWIPVDQQLRLDRDRYLYLLQLAKEAHFNMLRVWGGGLYETDDFYDLCDELGILVWQEFLSNKNFANINSENFLEGVKENILRIRNHPSLSFYCGGNEFDPDDKGSKDIIDTIDKLIKQLDPQREFHRASPYMGDDHYWGVWHGKEPYTNYRVVRPFRSEAGLNTFPVLENYRKFTPKKYLWPADKTFIEYHGENQTRFQHLDKLKRYANEFGESSCVNEFIQKSQLCQALANAFNMEFCRSRKFRNSGLLYWQFNDIWPCVSWSLIDWYGTPKPGYYFVKRASRPVHIFSDFEKYLWKAGEQFSSNIYLLNDTYEPLKDHCLRTLIFDIDSNKIFQCEETARAEANQSVCLFNTNFNLPKSLSGKTIFLHSRLTDNKGEVVSENLYPIAICAEEKNTDGIDSFENIFSELDQMKEVRLKTSLENPEVIINRTGIGTARVTLSNPSDKLAFFIRIRLKGETEKFHTFYSDNYFSLLPGENKKVQISFKLRDESFEMLNPSLIISGWNCPENLLPLKIVKKE